jgi:hypothetical protein
MGKREFVFRVVAILLTVIMISALAGCSGGSSGLVGTWELVTLENIYLDGADLVVGERTSAEGNGAEVTFFKDGAYSSINLVDWGGHGTYSAEGNILIIRPDYNNFAFRNDFEISGRELTVTYISVSSERRSGAWVGHSLILTKK